jgi:dolichol-phosphate mannosyltransferase
MAWVSPLVAILPRPVSRLWLASALRSVECDRHASVLAGTIGCRLVRVEDTCQSTEVSWRRRLGGLSVISLVVPTYKERLHIETLVQRAGTALASTGEAFELIIVDDNSPDGTADAVRGLQATRPWLKLLVRRNARDLSTAVVAGWRSSRGDVLGCMDADLQHPPETLPKLVEHLRTSGADIVIASRRVRGGGVSDWSFTRRFVSWAATLLATLILRGIVGRVRDPMSGFFLLRRHVLDRTVLNPTGYKILLEVLARGNYTRIEEVPFVFEERFQGGSKIGASTVLKYLIHLLRISLETDEATQISRGWGYIIRR